MESSVGIMSAELKGGDQNLAPFFMGICRKALPEPNHIFRKLIFIFHMGNRVMRIILFSRVGGLSVLEVQLCPFLANSLNVGVLN